MAMKQSPDFDILIVGAGVVGLSLASSLRSSGYKILLAEAGEFSVDSMEEYDLRVNSIHLGSETFLNAINAWSHVVERRHCPYQSIQVWDSAGGRITFDASEIGEKHLGSIVENKVLSVALNASLGESSEVEKMSNATLLSLEPENERVNAVFQGQEKISARMVVGADGTNSAVRNLIGASGAKSSYQQNAFVAKIGTSESHENTAYQKFLPDGPLAFLPLADGSSSIVWSCAQERADELQGMDDDDFEKILAKCFDYRLGETVLESRRVFFPLHSFHLNSYLKDRVVLIGDAAHVIHPLAGMGANLGLMDAATLGEILLENVETSGDPWNYVKLREYERRRKAAVSPVMMLMDAFDWGFRSSSKLVQGIRGIGLGATNQFSLAKNTIMRLACGVTGDLPDLAKR